MTVVSWQRKPNVRSGWHIRETIQRTVCGLYFDGKGKIRTGEGVPTCPKCRNHTRPKFILSENSITRKTRVNVAHSDVDEAIEKFKRNGGIIHKLPDEITPEMHSSPRSLWIESPYEIIWF